jgi:hypothetical protein
MRAYTGDKVKGELVYDYKVRFLASIQFMFPENTEGKRRMRVPESTDYMDIELSDRGLAECIVLPPLPQCRAHAEALFGKLMGDAMDDAEADRRYGTEDELEGLI